MKSPFSLSEARVLYELAHREDLSAKEIGIELGLDAGYLSRIVQSFDENGLITRKPLASDRRQYRLAPDGQGASGLRQARSQFAGRSRRDAGGTVARRAASGWSGRWPTIERLLGETSAPPPARSCASHRPGDMGWVVQSQARSMPSEYGLDILVRSAGRGDRGEVPRPRSTPRASIAGSPTSMATRSARCFWSGIRRRRQIAPAAGRSGRARAGLGRALVANASASREACGYRKITLWTQSILVAARKIYQDAGFVLVASEPHRSFGQSLIGETWEREL